ncbi:MAG: DegT/DnrJ/EryC1/StrS family aminotransferase [bacterium]
MTAERIPLSRPDVSDLEIEEVTGVLRTPWLSMGPKVREFEGRFAAALGVRHAIAVSSGTSGLHLALRAVGLASGGEVITTPFSFVATANVVLFEGGRPVFVDVDPQTLNITPEAVAHLIDREYRIRDGRLVRRETGAPLVALLPVSVFGHPVDIDGFAALARAQRLPIVHDTCEAFGSLYWSRERRAWVQEAAMVDAAVFAFYPNKQITTGEGGIVVTQDDTIAAACRMGRNQGRQPGADWLEHEGLGFNYRMDELSAALGVAQMRRADELLARRAQVARWYDDALAPLEEVERPQAAAWARVAWFVYVIRVRRGIDRDAIMAHLAARGIAAKPYFPAIHLQPHIRTLGYGPGDFPVTEDVSARTIALPFFNALTRGQVHEVVQAVKEAIHAGIKA